MLNLPSKDPNEVLDYQVDWADPVNPRLETGETLTSSVFSIVTGTVVIASQSYTAAGIATVWLTGGTADEVCTILNRVTTSKLRTYDQSCRLRIRTK